jgi:hypothetical protein
VKEHNVSETGSVSVLRSKGEGTHTKLGSLNRAYLSWLPKWMELAFSSDQIEYVPLLIFAWRWRQIKLSKSYDLSQYYTMNEVQYRITTKYNMLSPQTLQNCLTACLLSWVLHSLLTTTSCAETTTRRIDFLYRHKTAVRGLFIQLSSMDSRVSWSWLFAP